MRKSRTLDTVQVFLKNQTKSSQFDSYGSFYECICQWNCSQWLLVDFLTWKCLFPPKVIQLQNIATSKIYNEATKTQFLQEIKSKTKTKILIN